MRSWRPAAGLIDRTLDAIPPASGAVVMGTGIVSTALSLDGHETISRVVLVLTALTWVALAGLLPARAARDRDRFRADVRTPAALTSVAGTAVLGTRLALLGWDWEGAGLLVIALVLWAALLVPVLTNWRTPTFGASLVLTVSTESLAVLAAILATREHAHWLLVAALAPFGLGLAFYLFVIARFDLAQLAVGRGDHWVTGGALAISTLAAARITIGARALAMLGAGDGVLKAFALGLWALTMLWLPVLLLAEALRPRLGYDVRRWSTVFPVGMYAACSFAVGQAAHASVVRGFARVWVWVALAVWGVVSAAMIRRAVQILHGEQRPTAPDGGNGLAPRRGSAV
ncbi:MAG: tellurite resistance/C4-dicarboxylate transporter family protein [Solirubrobacteraceae bacterium]